MTAGENSTASTREPATLSRSSSPVIAPAIHNNRRLTHEIGLCAALATVYVVAGKFGLALASVHASATAVWPPAGIALAALLIFGPRLWPGIFIGAFVTNEMTAGSHLTSLLIATGNTLEAVLGAWLVERLAGGRAAFNHGRSVMAFVFLTGLTSTIGATTGVTSLALLGFAEWTAYGPVWLTWWLGDTVGAIVVAPAIILWHADRRVELSKPQRVELLLLFVALLSVGWVVFVLVEYPLTFLCIPLSIWAGSRFGQREAATATGVLSILAVWGSTQGLGAFARESPHASLLLAQAFMAVTAVVGLSVAAGESGRRRAEERLRQTNVELESRVSVRTAELQSALDKLVATESRLAEAQEVAHVGSWEFNVPQNVVWWSEELYRMYGQDPTSFHPSYQGFLDLVHLEDRALVHRTVDESLTTGQPFEVDHRIVRSGGEVRTLRSQARVIRDGQGQVVRLLGTGQDITERKDLESHLRQAQKMEAVGLLAGGIAHDFNNLLTVISGYTDRVLERLEDAMQREDLQEVRKAAERAAALTRQLLLFSRTQVLRPQILDVNVLVVNIEKLLRRTIPEDISLVLDLAPVVETVKADSSQLEQVLLNLAVNARDAMPNGGELRFATGVVNVDERWAQGHAPLTPGRYVRLLVSDTGIGMSSEIQGRIFEPFFTTKELDKGTGLGLSTAYAIVKQSGGFIRVTSELGQGTAFEIYLPVVQEPLAHTVDSEMPPAVEGGSETILVAEDDGGVRRLAHDVLTSYGYSVLEARDGNEALAVARARDGMIHLLIADVVMPGLSGPDLARRLRVEWPGIRVFYTSGYTEHATMHIEGEPRFVFLAKPFLPMDLLRTVRETLDARVTTGL
jgi:PAS domain S-box-containing protein